MSDGSDISAGKGSNPIRDIGLQAYGWLGLNRRGTWLIRAAPVTHPAVRDYLAAHYRADAHGNWLVHNGPQLAYVALETAPLIVHPDRARVWHSHLGSPTGTPRCALIDEYGGLWLDTPAGPGWVDESALESVSGWLVDAQQQPATAELIESLAPDGPVRAWLECATGRIALQAISRADVPARLGFVPTPRPPD